MKPGVDYIGISTPFYCTDGTGQFVLHKRSKNCRDEHGRWDPGGGKFEFGSTLEENVLREVLEEYGCRGEILEQLSPQNVLREWDGQKTHWLAIPFFIKVNPEDVKINEPEYADDLGWFTLDTLPHPLHTAFEKALIRYKEYFEKYT